MNVTSSKTSTTSGLVVATHGQHCVVQEDHTQQPILCVHKGKKNETVVGDRVTLTYTSRDQGIILEILPRKNMLYRSDQYKQKCFAANLDQMIIMLATEPRPHDTLLARALIAAEVHDITPLIVLNKNDLTQHLSAALQVLDFYKMLGYPVMQISAKNQPEQAKSLLSAQLDGKTTLLLGQSGTGKSTLINLLIPNTQVATQEISKALKSGRHTTTDTRLYYFSPNSILIDSPGFQEFGLSYLTEGQLERAFPDFKAFLGHCQFYNCHHLHEPGCAILNAVENSAIQTKRHALYRQVLSEITHVTNRHSPN